MLFLVTLNQSHWPGENSHANHQHKLKTLNIHSTFVSFPMLNILKICCICFTETVNSKSYASKAFLSLKMQATGMVKVHLKCYTLPVSTSLYLSPIHWDAI